MGLVSRKEPSLSSTSATSRSPCPSLTGLAKPPGRGTRPPIRAVGSRPAASSRCALIADVVVFPWEPAIAIASLVRITSASRAPRPTIGIFARRAASSSGLSSGIADDRTMVSAPSILVRSCPISMRTPSSRRRSMVAPRTTSEPETSNPWACSNSARAAMPIPPIPTKWR